MVDISRWGLTTNKHHRQTPSTTCQISYFLLVQPPCFLLKWMVNISVVHWKILPARRSSSSLMQRFWPACVRRSRPSQTMAWIWKMPGKAIYRWKIYGESIIKYQKNDGFDGCSCFLIWVIICLFLLLLLCLVFGVCCLLLLSEKIQCSGMWWRSRFIPWGPMVH